MERAEPEPVKLGKDDVVGPAGGAAVDSVAARVTGVASLTIFGKGEVVSPTGGAAGEFVAAGATGDASLVPGTATGDVLTISMTTGAPLVTGRLPFAGLLAPVPIALILSVVGGDEAGVVLVADVAGVVATVVGWVSEAEVVKRVTVLEVLEAGTSVAEVDGTGVVKVVEQSNNRLAWTKIN
jgi:hypothetical protein